jgi:hypothetical protein
MTFSSAYAFLSISLYYESMGDLTFSIGVAG